MPVIEPILILLPSVIVQPTTVRMKNRQKPADADQPPPSTDKPALTPNTAPSSIHILLPQQAFLFALQKSSSLNPSHPSPKRESNPLHDVTPLHDVAHVGAAEGCDLLILKNKIKRSQPSAAPTDNFGNFGNFGNFSDFSSFSGFRCRRRFIGCKRFERAVRPGNFHVD